MHLQVILDQFAVEYAPILSRVGCTKAGREQVRDSLPDHVAAPLQSKPADERQIGVRVASFPVLDEKYDIGKGVKQGFKLGRGNVDGRSGHRVTSMGASAHCADIRIELGNCRRLRPLPGPRARIRMPAIGPFRIYT